MNRFFSLIVILSLLISCGKQANQSTNPENDENVLPNENTTWTKYGFVFGYLKDY